MILAGIRNIRIIELLVSREHFATRLAHASALHSLSVDAIVRHRVSETSTTSLRLADGSNGAPFHSFESEMTLRPSWVAPDEDSSIG
ncbi:hypothetical protein AXG93_4193s1470 [Marchantia polymorpha subsp. ruderalis]|uniref:Uncharacterized protein n=1 Tax=Marchantia polymorpha subsp. ruderalis TaxID=1480154 RepID=A0A176W6J2_MARPO|nr:hypothetical protein AXG93_4193s1470 [Marchantia polymorpha subsp. ruderalis]